MLAIDKEITINLNGHDIIRTTNAIGAAALYVNDTDAVLTLTGSGKVSGYSYAVYLAQGKAIINGGEFSNSASGADANVESVVCVDGQSEVTINGGTFTSADYGIQAEDDAVVTINGGIITGGNAAVKYCCHVDLTINGGSFVGNVECEDPCYSTGIVYDGTFTDNRP